MDRENLLCLKNIIRVLGTQPIYCVKVPRICKLLKCFALLVICEGCTIITCPPNNYMANCQFSSWLAESHQQELGRLIIQVHFACYRHIFQYTYHLIWFCTVENWENIIILMRCLWYRQTVFQVSRHNYFIRFS